MMQEFIPFVRRIALDEGMPSLVGNTPLLPLVTLASGTAGSVQVFAKAEWFNPERFSQGPARLGNHSKCPS